MDARLLAHEASRYLRHCFHAQSPPRAGELAARLGMSAVQLSRTFVRTLGMPPSRYLKLQQIAFARRLLTATCLTTNEIAYRAGFGTRATFFRLFRDLAGATPRRFKTRRWRRRR